MRSDRSGAAEEYPAPGETVRSSGAQRYLVIANRYPSEEDLYRNAFIHRRVKAYQTAGLMVEAYYVDDQAKSPTDYVFDGVHVQRGNSAHYSTFLESRKFDKFLVHFPRSGMLEPIRQHHSKTPVIAWVHGFETEQWHRRWFNFVDDPKQLPARLERRRAFVAPQLAFMKWLFTTTELDVTIVQISKWFKEHVSEPDVGAVPRKSVVIPNVIDTELFPYRVKSSNLRTRILAIRPYDSLKYANDLTVQAIQILAGRPYFDQLEFQLYGDGRLWDQVTEPLRGLRNVQLNQRFLLQNEISHLHAEHGVFLAPTRFDSQGVSMCEAMASGLVTISTNISAIPEFVEHETTGLLGAPESAMDIADLIEMLYLDPDLFQGVSARAAATIREQCGADATIYRELELIQS